MPRRNITSAEPATDVFMLATTWLNVDTGTNLEILAEKNATDTGSDSYSKILSSDPIKFFAGFKLFDPNSRKFLSKMMEEDGSKRPEIHEVLDFCKALWTDSGIGHPSVRNTELLVPQSSVLHNYYELRKETQWTRVEERPFEYWVLELKAVNPEDLKRIIVDNKIFDVHSQLMQNVKPVVEAAKFMLIQVKYAGRPASSSALAIYQGNVGTAKSICVHADGAQNYLSWTKGLYFVLFFFY
ncbi:hypothetical protein BKA69DRAFT_1108196 [Paraphysoderma sedebokerense]|nr:hypothetical protein BKA69DRAFT_1108196 [Paraphysoderma sedebokerense]